MTWLLASMAPLSRYPTSTHLPQGDSVFFWSCGLGAAQCWTRQHRHGGLIRLEIVHEFNTNTYFYSSSEVAVPPTSNLSLLFSVAGMWCRIPMLSKSWRFTLDFTRDYNKAKITKGIIDTYGRDKPHATKDVFEVLERVDDPPLGSAVLYNFLTEWKKENPVYMTPTVSLGNALFCVS
ncbi:hypothetical protein C8R44DRAFT_742842 [Mycena epipterygia]|nr:hypothetical protein C8R44DRAFT_742842 [Mycena epipterygia]